MSILGKSEKTIRCKQKCLNQYDIKQNGQHSNNGWRSNYQCHCICRWKISGEVFDWWIWFQWREKPTRTRLVKIFHAAYEKYEENRTKLPDWISTNDRIKDEAKQNFRNTDYALKLYKKVHEEKIDLTEPQFSDFYQPSSAQKRGEIIYVGASALAIRLAASRFFLKWKTQSFRQFITVRTDSERDWGGCEKVG